MFSILIPTFNNLDYLKLCIESIKKNSKFEHQIIIHINEGSDGTLEFVKNSNYEFTYSENNIGMPKALNKSAKLSKYNYILISHDDFYYCPEWDLELKNEIDTIGHNNFYISGLMVNYEEYNPSINQNLLPPVFDAGEIPKNFDEFKLLNNLEKIKTFDYQGTTKCPGLIHKKIWNKVGGWSEEFSPTGGDDTDFALKLWNSDVRIFKGIGKCSAYHFGSITTRKKPKSLFTYLGSRANKIFVKKWGMSINFFENHYLKSGYDKNKKMIFNEYKSVLTNPDISLRYLFGLTLCKLLKLYLFIIRYK